MKTALITGASSGIGRELALIFAQNGIKTILVARSKDKLEELASEIKSEYNIDSVVFTADLSVLGEDRKLYEKIKQMDISIDFLINNAGFGDLGRVSASKVDKYTQMITLNVQSLTRLTAFFVGQMKAKEEAYIMNVASTAAFQPIPYLNVYSATKAFVLSFSEALRFETKDSGLKISVLCPGATDTNFANVAGFEDSKMFDKTNKKSSVVSMSAHRVAQIAFRDMLKGKMTIVTGTKNKVGALMSSMIPFRKLIPATIAKRFKKMIAQ